MNQSPCHEGPSTEPVSEPETHAIAWRRRTISPDDAPTPAGAQTNRLLHILVVEDDSFFRELNTVVLLHAGYTVDSAEDGAAAWEALNSDHYDLVVTDNSMPKVSGVELIRKLHAAGMFLPVIMATGAIPIEALNSTPALQLTVPLLKPYPTTELVRLVKKALQEARPIDPRASTTEPADQTHTANSKG